MHPCTKIATALALVAAVTTTRAALVTVSDCSASPVARTGKKTVINRPADDVVIQCALLPLDGTQRVEVVANSIAIDGSKGGSVAAGSKGPAIDLHALGTAAGGHSIHLDKSTVTAANNNGSIDIAGPGLIELQRTALAAGDDLRITCTGASCPISLNDVRTTSDDLTISAQGIVSAIASLLRTTSPIDRIDITSAIGDVLLGVAGAGGRGAGGLVCRDDVLALCPGPDCPLPVVIETPEDAAAFCECNDKPNEIDTGIEGNLNIAAPQGDVDLRAAIVRVGESIDIAAQGSVTMSDASIQNCGPKNGGFTVTGSACQVGGATLLDDEPDAQPTLTCAVSGTAIQLGTCDN